MCAPRLNDTGETEEECTAENCHQTHRVHVWRDEHGNIADPQLRSPMNHTHTVYHSMWEHDRRHAFAMHFRPTIEGIHVHVYTNKITRSRSFHYVRVPFSHVSYFVALALHFLPYTLSMQLAVVRFSDGPQCWYRHSVQSIAPNPREILHSWSWSFQAAN